MSARRPSSLVLAAMARDSDDGEAERQPRRRMRGLIGGEGDSEDDLYEADDGDDLRDFIVDDDEVESSVELNDELSEAEKDGDFDGEPLNRPRRGSLERKRKRQSGDLSPRAERRMRRRELADIRADDDLDDPTRRAREAEKERASHMQFLVEYLDDVEVVEEQEEQQPLVCLNPSGDEGQPPNGEIGTENQPVFVHPSISSKLKKHQVKGTQFLWSHVGVEPTGFGCVLADFMGLGKTLQVITVVQAFLALQRRRSDGSLKRRHKHVLILAPTICVRNWEAEVVKWLGKKEARKIGVHTLESSREKKMTDRVHVVKQWHRRGGLLIMGYELYRILVLQSSGEEKIAKGNAKHAHLIHQMYECLSDPGPDLIVLDEGHRVRDHKSKLVKALSHVKTARRIILTGYPLQNHLEEYWTMVNFARPDYLGSLEDFKNRFVNPIENGQCVDSTEEDRRLARQRAFVLTNELKTLVLRRDQEYLFRQLPPKKEWVILCKLTEPQATLYRRFLQFGVPKRGELMPGVGGKIDVLGGYHISLAISNHPDVLQETYRELERAVSSGKLAIKGRKTKVKNDNDGEEDELFSYLAEDVGASCQSRRVSTGFSDEDDNALLAALDAPAASSPTAATGGHRLNFAREFMNQYTGGMLESSGKMLLLMELLKECKAIGDRVILFSQSIPTLNTVERMIAKSYREERRHANRISYLRIDGSTPQQERFRMIGQFNDWEEEIDLIMISTKAGGEGVNLCAGNRIIIFDVCWNPCNDSQSMCRSYRFGQLKPVFVYRFVSAGTMEKKVYDLQIRKEGVAKRIVDEKALERKFKNADLQNYFNLDEFEQAMQQQSSVLSSVTSRAPTLDADLDEGMTESGDSPLLLSVPGNDSVLQSVLAKMKDEKRDWVLDWFEQETMFEETIDDNCTADEQEEITASYRYVKATRRLKIDDLTKYQDKMLVVSCMHCRVTNQVYPEEVTRIPIPKYIECRYCKRQMLTSGAVPLAEAQAKAAAAAAANGGILGNRGYVPYNTQPVVGGAVPVQLDTGGADTEGVTVGGRVLPPHLYAIYLQQQQDVARGQRQQQMSAQEQQQQQQLQQQPSSSTANELIRRQLEQQRQDLEKRKLERKTWKLADRNLLVLRRGISRVQDLKREAQECGAGMAIEVNPQLTDIVSSMGLEETLQWLKLSKLPRDVELHDEAWLRNEIAKEKGRPLVQTEPAMTGADAGASAPSELSSPDATTSAVDTSHDTIPIDLSDSESEDEQIQDTRTANVRIEEEEDSDCEIIEILE